MDAQRRAEARSAAPRNIDRREPRRLAGRGVRDAFAFCGQGSHQNEERRTKPLHGTAQAYPPLVPAVGLRLRRLSTAGLWAARERHADMRGIIHE
jgi:hypothetical protein